LQSNNYWSSSERNANNAWNFNSDNGNWNNDNKDNDKLVRACLAYWVILLNSVLKFGLQK